MILCAFDDKINRKNDEKEKKLFTLKLMERICLQLVCAFAYDG